MIDADNRAVWRENCRSGSAWLTVVELEFQHIMADPDADDEKDRLAPSPSHAVNIGIDARSHCLLWLEDGSPSHARWSSEENVFRRIGDDLLISLERVRAWAALSFPVAQA